MVGNLSLGLGALLAAEAASFLGSDRLGFENRQALVRQIKPSPAKLAKRAAKKVKRDQQRKSRKANRRSK